MTKLTVDEGVCPLCGKDSVVYLDSDLQDDGDFYSYECECESCGATWNEDHRLTFAGVSRVRTEDGEEVADVVDKDETEGGLPYIIARRAAREWVKVNYGQSEVENPSWDIDALADYVVDKIKE